MSNKTKQEPATTGSPTPEPVVKKKRGRKPSKKQYFTSDVDAAIKEYLASSNQDERNNIYKTRIAYPFYKLAENLIHTFKFYYTEVDDLEDLKHEVICFLLEKLEDIQTEYENFISKQSEAINACNERLKQIDSRGIFKSDDEVGWFWEEMKKIQDALNEFTLK